MTKEKISISITHGSDIVVANVDRYTCTDDIKSYVVRRLGLSKQTEQGLFKNGKQIPPNCSVLEADISKNDCIVLLERTRDVDRFLNDIPICETLLMRATGLPTRRSHQVNPVCRSFSIETEELKNMCHLIDNEEYDKLKREKSNAFSAKILKKFIDNFYSTQMYIS